MHPPLEEVQQQVAQLANEETAKNLDAAALRVLELTSVNRRCNAQILILVKALRQLTTILEQQPPTSLTYFAGQDLLRAVNDAKSLLVYFAGVE